MDADFPRADARGQLGPASEAVGLSASGLLGYYNYSDGRPDPRRQRELNEAFAAFARAGHSRPWEAVCDWLLSEADRLEQSGSAAYRNLDQARAVVRLGLLEVPAAYRQHHADLLADLTEADLFQPFFLARACEAVLAQAGPWDQTQRIVQGALNQLNDFVGYRPVAVLERHGAPEIYPHERVRPIPLYIRGAGVAYGPAEALISVGLEILQAAPEDLLDEAGFVLDQLQELAVDPRAYDHSHPVNRRPNYLFGEWDPHTLDSHGRYARFVIRRETLAGLTDRLRTERNRPAELVLYESAAVFAGIVLMAAGISGSGPMHHDSGVTLSNLVPRIARYRDHFYERLLAGLHNPIGDLLREEAKRLRQPFGHVRQSLNQALTQQRATQLQERRLALMFAQMGFPQASRTRIRRIQTASMRFLTEIKIRHVSADRAIKADRFAEAHELLAEANDLIYRGINCGALVDPWNILGFQGLFPLFNAREDTIRDPRVDELLEVVSGQLDLLARAQAAAAMAGDESTRCALSEAGHAFAKWWDRYATADVSDLPHVLGQERADAADHVAHSLACWHRAKQSGEKSSDQGFWRRQLDGLCTPAAFAQVIAALKQTGDRASALALLLTWLSEAETIPLAPPLADDEDQPCDTFASLLEDWLRATLVHEPPEQLPATLERFFDLLEANADSLWQVPVLRLPSPNKPDADADPFAAAYEEVTYRDTADDGNDAALLGDDPSGSDFPLAEQAERLERRLQFLTLLARLWQISGRYLLQQQIPPPAAVNAWGRTAASHDAQLMGLMRQLNGLTVPEPLGTQESVAEYDRRRTLKESLVEQVISTVLEYRRALWVLGALHPDTPYPAEGSQPRELDELARRLKRAIRPGDVAQVGQLLPKFLAYFRREPLIFVPLSDGGAPEQILRARLAQMMLQTLLEELPRLGLLREAFNLLKIARAMEQNKIEDGTRPRTRRITEFDRLFRIALQAEVEAMLDSSTAWPASISSDTAAMTRLLSDIIKAFQKLWNSHSQTLRLSVLETVSSDEDKAQLRQFIQRYGHDLFTPSFLAFANLRGILHRGIAAHLEAIESNPDDPLYHSLLLTHLRNGTLPHARACALLESILSAVLENYEEYRDYNSTTTNSDYGENLYILIDFLRLKVEYDRYAWRLRPALQTHEVLCRRNLLDLASRWQSSIADLANQLAEKLLADLARLEMEHGVRLRSVRDRIEERFVRSLTVDELCAAVEPALREANGDETHPAFVRLSALIDRLAATPTGAGLEVPGWIRKLEQEVKRILRRPAALPMARRPVKLTYEDFQRQLDDWDKPLLGE